MGLLLSGSASKDIERYSDNETSKLKPMLSGSTAASTDKTFSDAFGVADFAAALIASGSRLLHPSACLACRAIPVGVRSALCAVPGAEAGVIRRA